MKKQTFIRAPEDTGAIEFNDGRKLSLHRPLVMGVLNVTPDSFSDGGQFTDADRAVNRALEMIECGADIIDIGGESSRPGAEPVELSEELDRVMPVIQRLRQRTDTPISIDTYKARVAASAVDEGVDIINDISALRFDPEMVSVAARTDVPLILMHMLGKPRDMQMNPAYVNCVKEIKDFFVERIAFARAGGVNESRIIIDPGIGFGKRLSDNLELLKDLSEFTSLKAPILVGTSRKSFIGMLSPSEQSAEKRIGGSIAAAVMSILNGADIVRVHDVRETVEALKVLSAIRKGT